MISLVVYLLLQQINLSYAVIQDFNSYYSTCQYTFKENQKTYIFPDKVWTLRQNEYKVSFRLCSPSSNKDMIAWLENENGKLHLLGRSVQINEDGAHFQKGDICKNGTFSLSIQFECSDSISTLPVVSKSNECNFYISMMSPTCQPKCTYRIHGIYLVDLRSFNRIISVNDDQDNYSITLCGPNPQCNSTAINACKTNKNFPIGETKSQSVYYNIEKNELVAKGTLSNKKNKIIKKYEVVIKCNWTSLLTNVQHVKFSTQSNRYKFMLESSYGCVLLPHNCLASSLDNYKYDLSGLYRNQGWVVKKTPNKKILMNFCGPSTLPGNCSKQNCQVCELLNGISINRGSILLPLRVDQDVVFADFVSGETCNQSIAYTTRIEFICSKINNGPIYKSNDGCLTVLTWETPHACPSNRYVGEHCVVQDRIALSRNLQQIYSRVDKKITISQNSELIYNLCGPLHVTCDGYKNISFCLKSMNKDEDVVIGWENKQLMSENGILKMELNGKECLHSNKSSKVNIYFPCSFEEKAATPNFIFVQDTCELNLTVPTSLACASENKFQDCIYVKDSLVYNLSELIRKKDNYFVNANGNSIYLNVCGPIISNNNAMCRKNTMVCMKTNSANVKYKFISLGGVGQPKIINDTLVIESSIGMLCEDFDYYRSIIYFKCSNQEESPTLIENKKCVYKFEWRTRFACPRNSNNNCIVKNDLTNKIFDMAIINEQKFKINIENYFNEYEFDLCSDSFIQIKNGTIIKGSLGRNFTFLENTRYITLDLITSCNATKNEISKVIIEITCNPIQAKDYYEEKLFSNCTVTMLLKSYAVCTNLEKITAYNYFSFSSTLQPQKNFLNVTSKENSILKNLTVGHCFISNPYNHDHFNLSYIKNEIVVTNGNNYYLNFNGSGSTCNALFCKNTEEILSLSSDCPKIQYSTSSVHLHYVSKIRCDNDFYQLEMFLQCPKVIEETFIKENGSCSILVYLREQKICGFFIDSSNSFAIILGTLAGCIIFLFICCFIICFFKRTGYCKKYSSLHYRNNHVQIDTRVFKFD